MTCTVNILKKFFIIYLYIYLVLTSKHTILMSLQYTTNGIIFAHGFEITGAGNLSVPVIEKDIITNFLDGQSIYYVGKNVLWTEKEYNLTYTNLDFKPTNSLTYDSAEILQTTGSLSLKKSIANLIPSAKWMLNSTVNQNVVVDTSGNGYNGVASQWWGGDSNSYYLRRCYLNAGKVLHFKSNQYEYLDMWVKFVKHNKDDVLWSKFESNVGIRITSDETGKIRIYQRTVGGLIYDRTTDNPVAVGAWTHLAFIKWNTSVIAIYKNGVLQTLTVGTDTLTGQPFEIFPQDSDFIVGHVNVQVKNIYYKDNESSGNLTGANKLLTYRYNNGVPVYGGINLADPVASYTMEQTAPDDFIDSHTGDAGKHFTDTEDVSLVANMWNVNAKVGSGALNNIVGNDLQLHCTDVAFFNYGATLPYSISFWIKTASTGSNLYIISRPSDGTNRGGMLISMASGKISYATNRSDYRSTLFTALAYNDNAWHFVTVTYDGSQNISGKKIYVDGVLDMGVISGTETVVYGLLTTHALQLGQLSNSDFWLDQLLLFNYALSASNVEFYYNAGNGTATTGVSLTPTYNWYLRDTLKSEDGITKFDIYDVAQDTYADGGLYSTGYELQNTGETALPTVTQASNFGIDMWIYATSVSGDVTIFKKYINGAGFYLTFDINRKFHMYISQPQSGLIRYKEYIFANGFNLNEWTHIAYSWSGPSLYINGLLNTIAASSGDIVTYSFAAGQLKFGPLTGRISDIKVNAASLTQSYVTARYNAGVKFNSAQLVTLPYPSSFWKFDETNGATILVDSGLNGYHIQCDTAPVLASGKIGNGMTFTSGVVQQRVYNGYYPFSIIDSMSLEVYYKPIYANASNIILYETHPDNEDIPIIYIVKSAASNIVNFRIMQQQYIPPDKYPTLLYNVAFTSVTNTWYHVVFTYDGTHTSTSAKIYVNGVSQPITYTPTDTQYFVYGRNYGGSFPIVARYGDIGNSADMVDELSIYNNYIMTQTDVNYRYNNGTAIRYSNPLALEYKIGTVPTSQWRFDETAGTHASFIDSGSYGLTLNVVDQATHLVPDVMTTATGKLNNGLLLNSTSALELKPVVNTRYLWDKNSKFSVEYYFKSVAYSANAGFPYMISRTDSSQVFSLAHALLNTGPGTSNVSLAITTVGGTMRWDTPSLATPYTGSWYHIAIVYNGMAKPDSLSVYFNGVLQNITFAATGNCENINWSSGTAYYQNMAVSGDSTGNMIDELIFYDNGLLTPEDVANRYAAGVVNRNFNLGNLIDTSLPLALRTHLVPTSHYGFNELTGTSFVDIGSYANDLTIAAVNPVAGKDYYAWDNLTPVLATFTSATYVWTDTKPWSVEFYHKDTNDSAAESDIINIAEGTYEVALKMKRTTNVAPMIFTLYFKDSGTTTYTYTVSIAMITSVFQAWKHIVIMYDGCKTTKSFSVYINGQFYGTSTAAGTFPTLTFTGAVVLTTSPRAIIDELIIYDGQILTYNDVLYRYNSGTVNPYFDTNRDGLLYSKVSYVNQCLDMSALTGKLAITNTTIGNVIATTQDLSLETKFRFTSLEYGTILSKYDESTYKGYKVSMLSSGKIQILIATGPTEILTVTTTATFNNDAWHRLFVTYNHVGPATIVYVDTSTPQALDAPSGSIGASTTSNSQGFEIGQSMTGLVSNTLVYMNKVLSTLDIDSRLIDEFRNIYPTMTYKTAIIHGSNIPNSILNKTTVITFNDNAPNTAIEYVKYAFQIGTGLYAWNGTTWGIITNITNGNKKAVLNALTTANWLVLKNLIGTQYLSTWYILAGFYTERDYETPYISSIVPTYVGWKKLPESDVSVEFVDDAGVFTTIKNLSGAPISKLGVYTMALSNIDKPVV